MCGEDWVLDEAAGTTGATPNMREKWADQTTAPHRHRGALNGRHMQDCAIPPCGRAMVAGSTVQVGSGAGQRGRSPRTDGTTVPAGGAVMAGGVQAGGTAPASGRIPVDGGGSAMPP